MRTLRLVTGHGATTRHGGGRVSAYAVRVCLHSVRLPVAARGVGLSVIARGVGLSVIARGVGLYVLRMIRLLKWSVYEVAKRYF